MDVNGVDVDGMNHDVGNNSLKDIHMDGSTHKVAIIKTAKASRPGLSPQEVVQAYSDWTEYDEHLNGDCYTGPMLTADAVAFFLSTSRDASILDVAAGTGKVGAQLKDRGFTNVDALEPSTGMMLTAKKRGIYRLYFSAFFTKHVDVLETSSYDALVCCGGLMDGHLKCDALTEMVRCVKPGGVVVLAMREEFLQTVSEYKDRLEPCMKQLEKDGQWTCVERSVIKRFFCDYNGVRFVFKVTKDQP